MSSNLSKRTRRLCIMFTKMHTDLFTKTTITKIPARLLIKVVIRELNLRRANTAEEAKEKA
jgi:hypothetical protein